MDKSEILDFPPHIFKFSTTFLCLNRKDGTVPILHCLKSISCFFKTEIGNAVKMIKNLTTGIIINFVRLSLRLVRIKN